MRSVFRYIREYALTIDKRVLALTTLFTALLVFINYHFGLDERIDSMGGLNLFAARYVLFLLAFLMPYLFYSLLAGKKYFTIGPFVLLGVVAPSFFALKTALVINLPFANDAVFWNKVIYWPVLLVIMLIQLAIVKRSDSGSGGFYGLTGKNLVWKPYIIMLLIMIPLIAVASTQPDFLHTYPKLQNLEGIDRLADIPWWKKLLFELSYGSDFLSIELFFRGFLIIAFVKWAGKDAILPMACFYCTIHFGKPLAECISSYFGGLLLGILVYNTRSVLGGLMVHLGIAWMMELGGFIGNGWSLH